MQIPYTPCVFGHPSLADSVIFQQRISSRNVRYAHWGASSSHVPCLWGTLWVTEDKRKKLGSWCKGEWRKLTSHFGLEREKKGNLSLQFISIRTLCNKWQKNPTPDEARKRTEWLNYRTVQRRTGRFHCSVSQDLVFLFLTALPLPVGSNFRPFSYGSKMAAKTPALILSL